MGLRCLYYIWFSQCVLIDRTTQPPDRSFDYWRWRWKCVWPVQRLCELVFTQHKKICVTNPINLDHPLWPESAEAICSVESLSASIAAWLAEGRRSGSSASIDNTNCATDGCVSGSVQLGGSRSSRKLRSASTRSLAVSNTGWHISKSMAPRLYTSVFCP